MSDSYTPPIKVNRINRNLGVKVHLYFNKDSHNRDSDTTPRFYLKAVELVSIEGVAFTSKSHGIYTEYGNRFWRYKEDAVLTNEQVESLLFPLFYLCGLDEIIEKHWNSLDYQEKNYKKIQKYKLNIKIMLMS